MNIGELARRTGVSIRSLRYYEEKQLLSPQRGDNRYRTYDHTAIERVRTIQFYLGLGLTTNEIYDIVWCSSPENLETPCEGSDLSSCPEEIKFYQGKLAEIETQITSLEQARISLQKLLAPTDKAVSV